MAKSIPSQIAHAFKSYIYDTYKAEIKNGDLHTLTLVSRHANHAELCVNRTLIIFSGKDTRVFILQSNQPVLISDYHQDDYIDQIEFIIRDAIWTPNTK